MYQSNLVRNEVQIPLLPKISHNEKLHVLKNYSAPLSLSVNEAISIARISLPLVFTGLLLYLRSFVSLFFLGGLGDHTLAGGSLALAFANITGYSFFSGLTMGVESICSQAFGARRYNLVMSTIRRGIILLLFTSLPVSLLWINIDKVLKTLKQDRELVSEAHTFLLYSVPDLIAQSFLHPLRVYLRTQSKTLPLSICTAVASVLHLPITFFLVSYLGLGIKGIALSGVVSNINLLVFLFVYITFLEEKLRNDDEEGEEVSEESCGREWKKLLGLAIPSCVSVCLEWWCYEIMIVLCGLLINPKATIASMGIIIQITSLVYIFPNSLSFGVSTRVGNELGSNQPQRARRAAIVGLGLSIALGFTAFSFTFSVRNIWARIFTDDEEIIKLTLMVLPIVGLCELGNCPQTTGCGVLRGSARPRIGANINMAAFYVIGMPLGMVMTFWFGFGFKGLWLGMLAAQIVCVCGMMVVTCRTNWELEAARARELTAVDGGRGSDYKDVEVGKVGGMSQVRSLGVIEDCFVS
ncbi:Protein DETOXIFICATION 50 [Hirschfeldia incana]|nr:Protein DETOXIFICATION 50 [Hirschfeldia incana]